MPVFQTPLWLMCYDHEFDPGGVGIPLTHCTLDNMTNILQAISQMNFEWKFSFFIHVSLKFDPNRPIDNISAFVKIKAWRRIHISCHYSALEWHM